MARMRTIKPGYFTNDALASVDPLGRILFAGLWCHADREGRLEDRPRKLKAEVLPYDDCNVDKLLDALHSHGFIIRYESGGVRYIQVQNFDKHQSPHVREPASTIPAPGLHQTSTMQAPDKPVSQESPITVTGTLTELPPAAAPPKDRKESKPRSWPYEEPKNNPVMHAMWAIENYSGAIVAQTQKELASNLDALKDFLEVATEKDILDYYKRQVVQEPEWTLPRYWRSKFPAMMAARKASHNGTHAPQESAALREARARGSVI